MKKFLQLSVLTLTMCAMMASVAFARDIVIRNACDFAIGVAMQNVNEGDNTIELGALQPGEGVTVDLANEHGWIIVAADEEGTTVEFTDLSFAGGRTFSLHADGTMTIDN